MQPGYAEVRIGLYQFQVQ